MSELECKRCDYKFKRAAVPEKCPYCSKEGTVRLLKTAQDFLDESIE